MPSMLPYLLLLAGAGAGFDAFDTAARLPSLGAQLGGGRCYSTQPPPRAYCKPGNICAR